MADYRDRPEFLICWTNKHGLLVDAVWHMNKKDGPLPSELGPAAFRLGVPDGTPVACICESRGVTLYGVSRNPRKRKRREG